MHGAFNTPETTRCTIFLLLSSPPSLPPFCALPGVTVSPYLLAKTTQPTQKTFPLKLPRLSFPRRTLLRRPSLFFFWGEGGREGKNGEKKKEKKRIESCENV